MCKSATARLVAIAAIVAGARWRFVHKRFRGCSVLSANESRRRSSRFERRRLAVRRARRGYGGDGPAAASDDRVANAARYPLKGGGDVASERGDARLLRPNGEEFVGDLVLAEVFVDERLVAHALGEEEAIGGGGTSPSSIRPHATLKMSSKEAVGETPKRFRAAGSSAARPEATNDAAGSAAWTEARQPPRDRAARERNGGVKVERAG